jgi:outer membrane protein assembly factor BamB
VAVQKDGKVVVGGHFTTIDGINRNCIARLNADGSLDGTFNVGTGADDLVWSVAVQADGKVLVGDYNGLRRFDTNGQLDQTFFPMPNGEVKCLVVQPNGQIIVEG